MKPTMKEHHMSSSKVLALAACITFVLAAFSVHVGAILLVPVGLTMLAASFVVD